MMNRFMRINMKRPELQESVEHAARVGSAPRPFCQSRVVEQHPFLSISTPSLLLLLSHLRMTLLPFQRESRESRLCGELLGVVLGAAEVFEGESCGVAVAQEGAEGRLWVLLRSAPLKIPRGFMAVVLTPLLQERYCRLPRCRQLLLLLLLPLPLTV